MTKKEYIKRSDFYQEFYDTLKEAVSLDVTTLKSTTDTMTQKGYFKNGAWVEFPQSDFVKRINGAIENIEWESMNSFSDYNTLEFASAVILNDDIEEINAIVDHESKIRYQPEDYFCQKTKPSSEEENQFDMRHYNDLEFINLCCKYIVYSILIGIFAAVVIYMVLIHG